jgi:hypothetical protein
VLFRVESKSGHGASSATKAIKLAAHIYSFVFYNLESRRTTRVVDDRGISSRNDLSSMQSGVPAGVHTLR